MVATGIHYPMNDDDGLAFKPRREQNATAHNQPHDQFYGQHETCTQGPQRHSALDPKLAIGNN